MKWKNPLPTHVAIIMDGNGRWAKRQNKPRIEGHQQAIQTVDTVVTTAAELGIPYLTLYTFSTENWNRPQNEVQALMQLLNQTLVEQRPKLLKNSIRLQAIGELERLPKKTYQLLQETIELTQGGQRMTLILALSYGARNDICLAVRKIAEKIQRGMLAPKDITKEVIKQHLSTSQIPDPDLLIRTGGEYRISNFLLWEIAYTELYISSKCWPEFTKEDFLAAIEDYRQRERRFGKVSEQLYAS